MHLSFLSGSVHTTGLIFLLPGTDIVRVLLIPVPPSLTSKSPFTFTAVKGLKWLT